MSASLESKNQEKINCLLNILQKTQQILKENNQKSEAQKLLQEIEKKHQVKELVSQPEQEIDKAE